MAKQIEAEVRDLDEGVIAREVWALWFVLPGGHRWEFDGWRGDEDEAAGDAAQIRAEGARVRIVHYTLPALTIEGKEK